MDKLFDELHNYRLACYIGMTVYPLTGFFYFDYYYPNNFDGLIPRLPMVIMCGLILWVTYKIKNLKIIRFLIMVAGASITYQIFYFSQLSNYHPLYLTCTVQTPFIVLIVFYNIIDALIFFFLAFLGGILIMKGYPLDRPIFFSQLFAYLVAYYVFLSNRKKVEQKLSNNFEEINKQKSEIEIKNKNLGYIGDLAAQVAHDIRSPVLALKTVAEHSKSLESDSKQLIKKAATRINDIADYLISEYKTSIASDLTQKFSVERPSCLSELIKEIIEEKKYLQKIKFNFDLPNEKISVPENLNLIEFKRILSNIINNASEAMNKDEKIVVVILSRTPTSIQIEIKDNGIGIPQEVISGIFEKGVSYNKDNGTGLGLYHAKKYLESINGSISISSELGKGTNIIIELETK
jgi:signal transduction histidine kinase